MSHSCRRFVSRRAGYVRIRQKGPCAARRRLRRLPDHLPGRTPRQDDVRVARPVHAGPAVRGVAGRRGRLHGACRHRRHDRRRAVPSSAAPRAARRSWPRCSSSAGVLALREARKERNEEDLVEREVASHRRVAVTAFVVIFLAEWGDLTQILTANLAAHYHDPLSVGVGALLALWSVAALAVVAGQSVLRLINIATDPDRHRHGAVRADGVGRLRGRSLSPLRWAGVAAYGSGRSRSASAELTTVGEARASGRRGGAGSRPCARRGA